LHNSKYHQILEENLTGVFEEMGKFSLQDEKDETQFFFSKNDGFHLIKR